jgi:hypothetical protein
MSVTELQYYRLTCDDNECKAYLNMASDPETISATADYYKWWILGAGGSVSVVMCPKHKP